MSLFNSRSLGKSIREKRVKLGMTQEVLAKELGISQPTLTRWEREGVPERISPQLLQRVKSFLEEEKGARSPKIYQPTSEDIQNLKDRQRITYNDIARWYPTDFSYSICRRLVDYLIERVSCWDNLQLLDLGTGQGTLPFCLIDNLGSLAENMHITGIDFSSSMVELASKKAIDRNLKNVHFMLMDMENMEPFKRNQFDIVTSNLFVPQDFDKALDEASRVTRSGGYLAISFYGKASFSEFFQILENVFLNNGLVDVFSKFRAYKFAFDQNNLDEMLGKKGFDILTRSKWKYEISVKDGRGYEDFMRRLFPLDNILFRSMPDENRIHTGIIREINRYFKKQNVVAVAEIIYVIGVKSY
jgi:ubiquinone/menaquinone biosynthesis C-methylase UbiE/DNA-binding XRE family transcriptional regulator